jgi:hypothetical protein
MTTTVINKGTSPIKFNAGAVGSDITHEMIHAFVSILGQNNAPKLPMNS